MPEAQIVQEAADAPLKKPASHGVHATEDSLEDFPAGQLEQAELSRLVVEESAYLPAAQGMQAADVAPLYDPAGQVVQSASVSWADVVVPASPRYFPAAQCSQEGEPLADWYVPAVQMVHDVAAASLNFPAVQGVQLVLPAELCFPAAQFTHESASEPPLGFEEPAGQYCDERSESHEDWC